MRAAADHQLLSPLDPRRRTVTCACSHLTISRPTRKSRVINLNSSGLWSHRGCYPSGCTVLPSHRSSSHVLSCACLLAALLACLSSPLAPPSVRGKKNSNQAEIIRDREREGRRVTGRRTSAKKITSSSSSPPSLSARRVCGGVMRHTAN